MHLLAWPNMALIMKMGKSDRSLRSLKYKVSSGVCNLPLQMLFDLGVAIPRYSCKFYLFDLSMTSSIRRKVIGKLLLRREAITRFINQIIQEMHVFPLVLLGINSVLALHQSFPIYEFIVSRQRAAINPNSTMENVGKEERFQLFLMSG